MISIHDLLEDPKYKEYFCQVPKLPVTAARTPPWRVFILLKKTRQWVVRDFMTYGEAFKWFNRKRKQGLVHDAAIHCRRASFPPPVRMAKIKGKYITGSDGIARQATTRIEWKPRLSVDEPIAHDWCPWCRRPTVFRFYSKHHALGMVDPSVPRCAICGASTRVTDYRKPL